MKKIPTVLFFSVLVINISILIFSQFAIFAISDPFPGDSAIVAGNVTRTENMSSSQPSMHTNASIITNGSLLSNNNTNLTNQTSGMLTNNT